MATYQLTIPESSPYVRSGSVEFRCRFTAGDRTRAGVRGSEWSVAVGDTVTTDDAEAARAIARITDDEGQPMFSVVVTRRNDRDLDEEVFSRYRAARVR